MPHQKGFAPIILISGVLLLIIFFVGMFYLQHYRNAYTPSNIPDETANWKTYRNNQYGFELKYPSDWLVKEDVGSKTITFSPPKSIASSITITPVGRLSLSEPGSSPNAISWDLSDSRVKEALIAGRKAYQVPRRSFGPGGGQKGYERIIKIIDVKGTKWTDANEIYYQAWFTEPQLADVFDKVLSTLKLGTGLIF